MTTKWNSSPRERIIFALDVDEGLAQALNWVEKLSPHIGAFKVGKESFTRYGRPLVEAILKRGGRVFLDLKFHDIPNTTAAAAAAATELGATMFNVHALGGRAMLAATFRASDEAAHRCGVPRPILLAVTVLSSINELDMQEVGFSRPLAEVAVNLALLAKQEGLDGVVASGETVAAIRRVCGADFIIVTPGIRDTQADDDQKRTLTPCAAIAMGADYLVIGRPISKAPEPIAKCENIALEIASALAQRDLLLNCADVSGGSNPPARGKSCASGARG